MGFWNVRAQDLRKEDEVRVSTMGGEEFLTVLETKPPKDGRVRVRFSWAWHAPSEPFWDTLDSDEKLTVRR